MGASLKDNHFKTALDYKKNEFYRNWKGKDFCNDTYDRLNKG